MASDIKWIKVCTDIFDDEKILLIESMPESDSIIVIWFKLLCLAGKQNNGGVFTINDKIAYTDEMLASIFRRPLNTIRLALKTFEAYGMIEIIQGTITIPMWEKHQSIDKMERIREQNRERAAAFRARQKQITQACDVTENQSNVTVTLCNATELDKELELDKDINIDTCPNSGTKKSKANKDFISFNDFWILYPKKQAKAAAEKAYLKIKPDRELFEKMKKTLEAQKASFDWQKENGRYIPLPATWLNGKRWEDELEDVHSGLQSRNIENSTPGSDFEDSIF